MSIFYCACLCCNRACVEPVLPMSSGPSCCLLHVAKCKSSARVLLYYFAATGSCSVKLTIFTVLLGAMSTTLMLHDMLELNLFKHLLVQSGHCLSQYKCYMHACTYQAGQMTSRYPSNIACGTSVMVITRNSDKCCAFVKTCMHCLTVAAICRRKS